MVKLVFKAFNCVAGFSEPDFSLDSMSVHLE